MKEIQLIFLLLSVSAFVAAQSPAADKHSYQGIFLQLFQTKQIFNDKNAASSFKPGLGLGFYQHFDLSPKVQLRLGGSLSFYKMKETDYSPVFPGDINPGGSPDLKRSYFRSEVEIFQLNFPINLRFKLSDEQKHFFAITGIALGIPLFDNFNSLLNESGQSISRFDGEMFIDSRSLNILIQPGIGFEFPVSKGHKMHVEFLAGYGLLSQFTESRSGFMNFLEGKPLSLGACVGIVF